MNKRLIVALDVPDIKSAKKLVKTLYPSVEIFKIGSILFTACGPEVVHMVHKAGGRVFLDLKFHDIPNTVASAAAEAAKLGVFMFNLHASGGLKMMAAAVESARKIAANAAKPRPLILAVTVLTSMDEPDLRQLGILKSTEEQVLYLVSLAKEAGCDGAICSVEETAIIRKNLGNHFIIVTPGIRPAGYQMSDQKRVATPHHAIEAGADYIVVGRPIIEAADPLAAANKILEEMGV
jgi:orotidine-5'-phosphate decarboxylase